MDITPARYNRFLSCVPDDTVNIAAGLCDAIYCPETGNATLVLENGNTLLVTAIQAGTILPFKVKRVNATLTDLTVFVALYAG